MIIDALLINEKERNLKMIEEYEKLLKSYIKGVLIHKKTGYFYLKYRENGKIKDKYVGKNEMEISDIARQISERKHCENMLKELKIEKKKIEKIISYKEKI